MKLRKRDLPKRVHIVDMNCPGTVVAIVHSIYGRLYRTAYFHDGVHEHADLLPCDIEPIKEQEKGGFQ